MTLSTKNEQKQETGEQMTYVITLMSVMQMGRTLTDNDNSSTASLCEAILWKRASEVVFCHLRYGIRMGSFVVIEDKLYNSVTVCLTSRPPLHGHVAEQLVAQSVV